MADAALSATQAGELANLAGQLAQAPGLPAVLARLGQSLPAVVDHDAVALAMRSADGRVWGIHRGRLAAGGEPSWQELTGQGGPLESAIAEGRAIRVERAAAGTPGALPLSGLATLPSAVCLPLAGSDGPLGSLGVFSSRPRAFGPAEEAAVRLVASLVEAAARRFVLLDELARAERELERVEQLRAESTRTLAIDLTPSLRLLSEGLDLLHGAVLAEDAPAEARELVDDLRRTTRDLSEIVSNVRDTARLERGEVTLARESVVLDGFLRERLLQKAPRARGRDVTLLARVEPETARASFDPAWFGRVVDALVEHSLEHTPRRGQMAVVARVAKGTLKLAVGDTGPAIPPGDRDRLFTRFGAQVAGGELARPAKGLSLYFSRLVVELHGGRIDVVEPPAGAGALVRVSLPI